MITCLEKHCFSTNCYRILSKPACIFLSAGFVALLIRNYPCLIQLTHTLSKAWCLQSIILDLVYSGAGDGEGQVWNHQKPLEYEWSACGLESSQVALVVKNPPANAVDVRGKGLIPGSGRSPGEEHGNPLQYPCLENPMDRGVWWATAHRVANSWTWPKRLSTPYRTEDHKKTGLWVSLSWNVLSTVHYEWSLVW